MQIKYISYGILKTGGYRHEKSLFDTCVAYHQSKTNTEAILHRRKKLFTNIFAHLDLLIWSFFKSSGDINIVTARTAISAMLRNRFNKSEVWIVLHNFDPNDGKSKLLKWYYEQMFKMLKNSRHGRFKVLAVSPFWEKYFKEEKQIKHTYLFPNLFRLSVYDEVATDKKNGWVHLGQFSGKNDPEIIRLAQALSSDGYYCYFSTLDDNAAKTHNGKYEIIKFFNFRDYLEHMARSCCTLALTGINEGWNRVAHESILVGTPVIGFDKGGLGDLLRESNSIIVKDVDEAYTCIRESLWVLPDKSFNEKYSLEKGFQYMEKLCRK